MAVTYAKGEPRFIRYCLLCKAPMDEPLKEEGKLWLFCSSRCRAEYTLDKKLARQMARKNFADLEP